MKTRKLILCLLAAAAALLTACQKSETPAAEFEFKLSKDGAAITGVQTLNYGESRVFSFTAKGVASIVTEAPKGWSATASVSGRSLTVTAPAATDKTAATSGALKVKVTSIGGESLTETIQLAVQEGEVSLSVAGISEGVTFLYGENRSLDAVFINVASVQVSAPAGWEAQADIAGGKIQITAPQRNAQGSVLEGNVVLTPSSQRGTAGAAVTIAVSIKVTAPSINFTPKELVHVDFASENTITATEVVNVANLQVLAAPKGWNIEANMQNGTVKITAPAADATEFDGEGAFKVQVISASGETQDYSLPVSVKGINNAQEFLSLAEAYNALTEGQDPLPLFVNYIWNYEVVLNADIDLSKSGKAVFVENPFVYTFNGKGHSITLGYSGDATHIGLFKAVAAPGKIKNLVLEGTLTSTAYGPTMAALACISAGGSFEQITSRVALVQSGSAAAAGADAKGFCAGIVGDEQGNGNYNGCVNQGAISVTNVKFTGGIIADIWDKTEGKVTGCSNTGNITGSFGNHNLGNAQVGGVVANTIGSNWTFKNSFNKGNISYNFGKKNMGLRAVGGFAGTVFGTFDTCYNTGNVVNTDGLDSQHATRRVGGFGGAAWKSNDCVFKAKDCYNSGMVSDMCNYIGGFVGVLEEGDQQNYHYMENCYNSGKVIVASNNGASDAFGGFAGTLYNIVGLKNCRNEGKVVGVSRRCAGGLVGRAADYIVIDGCVNSGDLYVGAVEQALSKAYSPLAGGICSVAGTGSVVTITNSRNSGKVTAMSVYQEGVQSVYAAEAVLEKVADPSSDTVNKCTADAATVTASEGATIEWIAKNNWNIATILSWLQ